MRAWITVYAGYNIGSIPDWIKNTDWWKTTISVDCSTPDASTLLKHFLKNSGESVIIDFARMNRESEFSQTYMIKQIDEVLEAAEVLAIEGDSIDIITIKESKTSTTGDPSSLNWWFTIGEAYTWANAKVTKKGDAFTMVLSYNLRDNYDWHYFDHNGNISDVKGGLVYDREMALLNYWGRAQAYEVTGKDTMSITWTKGQRFTSGADVTHLKD